MTKYYFNHNGFEWWIMMQKRFHYLKNFQQGFHVKTPDAEGNSEDSRHNNEHQQ